MSDTPTPRTDAAMEWVRPAGADSAPPNEQYVSADFARQLERELLAANAALAAMTAERDALVKESFFDANRRANERQ